MGRNQIVNFPKKLFWRKLYRGTKKLEFFMILSVRGGDVGEWEDAPWGQTSRDRDPQKKE